jgi:protein-L-isoaspartate(D-aspartate) O-methyltransferase
MEQRSDPQARSRDRMVREQLEARGIRDLRVLQAMRDVPRHAFVDEALAGGAYGDHPIPIGFGQTISQPFMVAVMTELLRPRPEHRVLDVGTGSGYQAAVLSRLVRTVFGVERIPELTLRAQETLSRLGLENVVLMTGDGTLGWSRFAPFDGILVAAGGPEAPASLLEQLAEGGRLVMPTGTRASQRILVAERRAGGAIDTSEGIACTFVPLLGREGWPEGTN